MKNNKQLAIFLRGLIIENPVLVLSLTRTRLIPARYAQRVCHE